MTAILDSSTLSEYLTGLDTSASAGAQAVVDAIENAAPVYAKVYDDGGNLKASGTMQSPWATQSNGVITIAEVTGFQVSGAGPPATGWYMRFEAGTRWIRDTFGAVGSGAIITYSGTWGVGASGELGTITVQAPSNAAPSLVGAPSALSYDEGIGGSYDFGQHGSDPDGDTLTYSLIGTGYTGIAINATTGVLTVGTNATAAVRSITIRVSDGQLSSDWVVTVTIHSQSLRWNPGHYIKTQGKDSRTDQSVYWSQVLSEMDKAATFAPMKGAFINVAWGSFNTTGSTYDWTALDALFAKAATLNQQLIIALTYKNFESVIGLIAPSDLRSSDCYATSSGFISAVWRTVVMDRFLEAVQAFATRYASNEHLELVTWSESAPSWATVTPPGDYSNATLSTQLQRLTETTVGLFEHNFVMCNVNSLAGQLTQMIDGAFVDGGGFATPDAFDTKGVKIFRGEAVSGELIPPNGDLRGRVVHHEIASSPTLGGRDDNGPPSNIINWAQTNKVTHLSWVTSVTITGNTWADIKNAITADPLLHTAFPTG